MAEQEIVVDNERLSYEGVFSVPELYRLIDEWLLDKGYSQNETSHAESVKPKGRSIEITLEPERALTDYAKSILRIRIEMNNIKQVVITTKEGGKLNLNQGSFHMLISGILETDYENKWESKPVFMFIRSIYDKYIYKSLTGGFTAVVEQDVAQIKNNISAFLNLPRYKK